MMEAPRPPYWTGQGMVSQRRWASFLLNWRPNSDCGAAPSSVWVANWSCQPGVSSCLRKRRTSARNSSSWGVKRKSMVPPVRCPAKARLKPGLHRCVPSCLFDLAADDAAGDVAEDIVVLGADDGEPIVEDERGAAVDGGGAGPSHLLVDAGGVAAVGQGAAQLVGVEAAGGGQAAEDVDIADVLALLPVGVEDGALKLQEAPGVAGELGGLVGLTGVGDDIRALHLDAGLGGR